MYRMFRLLLKELMERSAVQRQIVYKTFYEEKIGLKKTLSCMQKTDRSRL